MIGEIETIRLECLREAVKVCTSSIALASGERLKDPVAIAKEFAGFVLGLTWDEEADEWVGPEEDPIETEEDFDPNEDVELKHAVRAYNDEGQEL